MKIQEHKAYQYAQDVVDGKIVAGKYIIKTCQRFINDVNNPNCKYFIDEKQLELITNLTGLINMPTGLRVGISAKDALVGFQWLLIVSMLCWFHKDDIAKRRYETAILLIGRKNGKSFLVALMILILMLTEPEHSEFYSVAPDRELSSIIKKEIAKMLDASPAINKYFKTVLKEVRCILPGHKTTFMPLATSNDRMDGRLASAFIADEIGALKTSYPIEAMESSQLNVKNRLGLLISTAYQTTQNPMVAQVDYAKKILDDTIENEKVFALLYMPDDMKNWQTDEALLHANPLAIELPENLTELMEKRKKAIETNNTTNFLTKHLNIFVDGDEASIFVSADDLQQCRISNYNWHGREVHVGVDLSQSVDNTSVSMVTYDQELKKFVCKAWAFMPEGNVDTKSNLEKVDYRSMKRQGFCYFIGDKVIDYGEIEKFVMELQNKYGVIVKTIGYDRYNAISSAMKWEEAGFNTEEIKQHSMILHPATKLLKESILNQEFAYEMNQLFEINVANAREVYDNNLNTYVNKKKSNGKIDMLAATINAMVLWNNEMLEGQSYLDQFGELPMLG